MIANVVGVVVMFARHINSAIHGCYHIALGELGYPTDSDVVTHHAGFFISNLANNQGQIKMIWGRVLISYSFE